MLTILHTLLISWWIQNTHWVWSNSSPQNIALLVETDQILSPTNFCVWENKIFYINVPSMGNFSAEKFQLSFQCELLRGVIYMATIRIAINARSYIYHSNNTHQENVAAMPPSSLNSTECMNHDCYVLSPWTHDVIIASLLRQNDVIWT